MIKRSHHVVSFGIRPDEKFRATKFEMTRLFYRQDVVISAFARKIGGKYAIQIHKSFLSIGEQTIAAAAVSPFFKEKKLERVVGIEPTR